LPPASDSQQYIQGVSFGRSGASTNTLQHFVKSACRRRSKPVFTRYEIDLCPVNHLQFVILKIARNMLVDDVRIIEVILKSVLVLRYQMNQLSEIARSFESDCKFHYLVRPQAMKLKLLI
jgi:hypothetical protein